MDRFQTKINADLSSDNMEDLAEVQNNPPYDKSVDLQFMKPESGRNKNTLFSSKNVLIGFCGSDHEFYCTLSAISAANYIAMAGLKVAYIEPDFSKGIVLDRLIPCLMENKMISCGNVDYYAAWDLTKDIYSVDVVIIDFSCMNYEESMYLCKMNKIVVCSDAVNSINTSLSSKIQNNISFKYSMIFKDIYTNQEEQVAREDIKVFKNCSIELKSILKTTLFGYGFPISDNVEVNSEKIIGQLNELNLEYSKKNLPIVNIERQVRYTNHVSDIDLSNHQPLSSRVSIRLENPEKTQKSENVNKKDTKQQTTVQTQKLQQPVELKKNLNNIQISNQDKQSYVPEGASRKLFLNKWFSIGKDVNINKNNMHSESNLTKDIKEYNYSSLSANYNKYSDYENIQVTSLKDAEDIHINSVDSNDVNTESSSNFKPDNRSLVKSEKSYNMNIESKDNKNTENRYDFDIENRNDFDIENRYDMKTENRFDMDTENRYDIKTNCNYNEINLFDNTEQSNNKSKRKQLVNQVLCGKETIFITGLKHGCGCSHTGLSFAKYILRAYDENICICHKKGAYDLEDEGIREYTKDTDYDKVFESNRFIIYDCGILGELNPEQLIELKRCNIKIMVCNGDEKYLGNLSKFIRKLGIFSNEWIFAFNLVTSREKEVIIRKIMEGYKICFIPLHDCDSLPKKVSKLWDLVLKRNLL